MERIPSSQGSSASTYNEVASEISEHSYYTHAHLSQRAKEAVKKNDLAALNTLMKDWAKVYDEKMDQFNRDDEIFRIYLECAQARTSLQERNTVILKNHKKLSERATLALRKKDLKKANQVLEDWALLFDNTGNITIVSSTNYWQAFLDYGTRVTELTDILNPGR